MTNTTLLVSPDEIDNLPEPIRTYAREAMTLSLKIIALANAEQIGAKSKLDALLHAYVNAALSLSSREMAIFALSSMAANLASMLETERTAATSQMH